MSEIKLTKYLDDMDSLYEKCRADYIKAVGDRDQAEKKYNEAIASSLLSAKGIEDAKETRNKAINLYKDIVAIINDRFDAETDKMRNNVNDLFHWLYEAHPSNMDLKTIELLKLGILSNQEIINLAESFRTKHNVAMYKACASYIKDSDNTDHMTYKRFASQPIERADLSTFDSYRHVLKSGLREDTLLANGIHDSRESLNADIRAYAETVCITGKELMEYEP